MMLLVNPTALPPSHAANEEASIHTLLWFTIVVLLAPSSPAVAAAGTKAMSTAPLPPPPPTAETLLISLLMLLLNRCPFPPLQSLYVSLSKECTLSRNTTTASAMPCSDRHAAAGA
jgi:hypothetical protein